MLNSFLKKLNLFLLIILTSYIYSIPYIDFKENSYIYKQYKIDIIENRKRISSNQNPLPIQIFKYIIEKGDTIFSVSAKFNLTYDTIATLNNIDNQLFFNDLKEIYIPNCLGKFSLTKSNENNIAITIQDKKMYFMPGAFMDSKERVNFLISPFKSPLKTMNITSEYGYRENPFTGYKELHPGIDLKADIGTPIYSPYSGRILKSTYNDFLGNTLVVDHGNGYTSHYYHLNSVNKKEGDAVNKGEYIAQTGNSGRSTGPHLHFEIRKEDEVINPVKLLGDV